MNRFQFVADHRDAFEVKRLCEIVQVARSSFYAWLAAAPARAVRASADAALAQRIRAIHDTDRAQGVPRITAALNEGVPPGARVNHKRVARVMRAHAIAGLRLRRKVRTTVSEPVDQRVPDLLGRDFTAPVPNRRYVGDITYLPIGDGTNLYLATVIDCFSRRLAGWAVAEHMRTDLIVDALSMARDARGSLAGAIFHSDHGSTARRPSPRSAPNSVSRSRWARSGPAPTTPWPSRSMPRSSARPCAARPAGPTWRRVGGRCSGG